MYISGMSNNYTIPINCVGRVTPINSDNTVDSSSVVKGTTECKTCENRLYVDGSNERDVTFKTPGHISPGQSYGKVMSHELEHVSNARAKGSNPGAKLISATISLKMATCPECKRMYVAGGVTKTAIEYNESNPYEKGRKLVEGSFYKGMNLDKVI